jgi:glycine/D-amino acid oxidase-like deaminating enzyme
MERRSVWLDSVGMPTFSSLGEDLEVDVAVVGGGLVGLTTALLAQRAGARVAVLEATRIGAGTSGHTTGKVTSQHRLVYADLIERHGQEAAQTYAEANQAGVEQVARLVGEFGIECDLTRAPAYAYTRQADQRHRVEGEVRAAQLLGLPASLTDQIGLPFEVAAAVQFDEQLHFHPGRYLAGLADALTRAGGLVFDNTRVTDVDQQGDHPVRVTTRGGTVRADRSSWRRCCRSVASAARPPQGCGVGMSTAHRRERAFRRERPPASRECANRRAVMGFGGVRRAANV